MSQDFQLRAAAAGDYAFCHDLCFQLMGPLLDASGSWFPEVAERKLAAKFRSGDPSIVLVDERPVGWILLREKDRYLHLEEIHIHPDYQGRGLGTAVLSHVLPTDRWVRLQVLRNNRAVSLYRRLGFATDEADEARLHMVRGPVGTEPRLE